MRKQPGFGWRWAIDFATVVQRLRRRSQLPEPRVNTRPSTSRPGFGLVEAALLAVALIAGDRDEGQMAGLAARS